MIPKLKKLAFLFFLLGTVLPFQNVSADTGPKPTMEFTFEQAGGLAITSGILYECGQPDCSDAEPLPELGPQRFVCEAVSCRALSYGFAPYHRLEIEFSDGKTRASNVFETGGFDSKYNVTIREADLLVERKFTFSPNPYTFLPLACMAMIGIVVVGLVVFAVWRLKKK